MQTQLSKIETMQYLIKIKENDQQALETFLVQNMAFIHYAVHHFIRSKKESLLSYDDYFQEGVFAFIKAAKMFDLKKGIQFSTYAYTCIYNQLATVHAYNATSVSISSVALQSYFKFQSNKSENADAKEISSSKIPEEMQKIFSHLDLSVLSFDTYNDVGLANIYPDINSYKQETLEIEKIDTELLAYALKQYLSPLEYYIIFYRYLSNSPKMEKEVYQELHWTQSSISQKTALTYKKIASKIKGRSMDSFIKKYGSLDDIKKTRLIPNSLTDISTLVYLKNNLSELEFKIFFDKDYHDYCYSFKELSVKYQLAIHTIEEIYTRVKLIKNQVSKETIENVTAQLLAEYNHTKIFELVPLFGQESKQKKKN